MPHSRAELEAIEAQKRSALALERIAAAAEAIAGAATRMGEHAPQLVSALEAIAEASVGVADLVDAVETGRVHVATSQEDPGVEAVAQLRVDPAPMRPGAER